MEEQFSPYVGNISDREQACLTESVIEMIDAPRNKGLTRK